jgi:hypothetical protein
MVELFNVRGGKLFKYAKAWANNGTMASMCYCHQTYTAYEFVCTEKSNI